MSTLKSTPTKPIFDWLDERSSGVLLHLSSLPGDLGIGTLGKEARKFINFLKKSGVKYWQILPISPTGYSNSPYQGLSAFSGNPYFIDLHELVKWKLLKPKDLAPLKRLPKSKVDFGALYKHHGAILEKAFHRYKEKPSNYPVYHFSKAFSKRTKDWLPKYAAYRAFKSHFHGKAWFDWPEKYRSYESACKTELHKELKDSIEAHTFYEYLFFYQWYQLRIYAHKKNVFLVGDIPLYVSLDSSDVWSNPHLFELDKDGQARRVTGVPPDYFNPKPQFWSHPLYRWDKHREEKFNWWLKRVISLHKVFDVLRLDHFRGFNKTFSISPKAKKFSSGKWVAGPGIDLFKAIKRKYPLARLIAEDLGNITQEDTDLRLATGLPGMCIIHFAFDGRKKEPYLPHNMDPNMIVYPGTHDNNTTLSWFESLSKDHKKRVLEYINGTDKNIVWDILKQTYKCVAKMAIVTVQDLLEKDCQARMNYPGQPYGHWEWRITEKDFTRLQKTISPKLKKLLEITDRTH